MFMRKCLAILVSLVLILSLVPANFVFAEESKEKKDVSQQILVNRSSPMGTSSIVEPISVGSTMYISDVTEAEYSLTISEAGTYRIYTGYYQSNCSPYIYLYDANYNLVDFNYYYGSSYSTIQHPLSPGTYYVYVGENDGTTLNCTLTVESVQVLPPEQIHVGDVKNINGVVDQWYRIDIPTNSTYIIETTTTGYSCDTWLELYDSSRTTWITYDDDSGPGLDSYIQRDIAPGTYYIRVREFSYGYPVYCTLRVSSVGGTQPPTVPTGLHAISSTETSITIGWTASTDNTWIAGYEVYRDGVKIGSPLGTVFTSIPLTPNKSYTFTVRAYDSEGNYSEQSAPITASTQPDTVLPTAPTGLTATNITETRVTLTWNASTDNTGIRGYKLYCNGSLLANPSSTTITPGWRIPGQTYVFTVTAIDLGFNESPVGEPLSVTMLSDTQMPSIPTGLTVIGVTQNSVSLSWTASTDNSWVAGYEVYRDGVYIGSPLGTVFTSTPLSSGRTYSFTVKACDVAGNVSDESETVWATTN